VDRLEIVAALFLQQCTHPACVLARLYLAAVDDRARLRRSQEAFPRNPSVYRSASDRYTDTGAAFDLSFRSGDLIPSENLPGGRRFE